MSLLWLPKTSAGCSMTLILLFCQLYRYLYQWPFPRDCISALGLHGDKSFEVENWYLFKKILCRSVNPTENIYWSLSFISLPLFLSNILPLIQNILEGSSGRKISLLYLLFFLLPFWFDHFCEIYLHQFKISC